MRYILGLLVVAAIVGGFLKLNRQETPVAAPPAAVRLQTSAASESGAKHWPKRALDRAAEVKREVAAQEKSNEGP